MNKHIKRGTALAALAGGAILATPGTAQAVECGTPAKDAVFETVVTPGSDAEFTTVQVVDQEAVPAIEAIYEDIKVIDQEFVPAIPGTPAVEEVSHIERVLVTPATDEVPAVYEDVKVIDVAYQPGTPGSPEVPEVSHIERTLVTEAYDETIVDKEAYTEVIQGQWWVWAPNNSQGPQDYTPTFPTDERGTWIGPKTEGGPEGEGTFNVSHGNSGNSSWFHRDADQVIEHPAQTHVVHHDAVYDEVKVIDQPYVPAIPPTPPVEEVSHIEHVLVTPAIPGHEAVYEDVKVIDVEAKPAVPGTPEVAEVSHIETILVSPGSPGSPATYKTVKVLLTAATPATSTQVLVSKATEATEDCVTPSAQRRGLLAFTGPSDIAPLTGLAVVLLAAGGVAIAGARSRRNQG